MMHDFPSKLANSDDPQTEYTRLVERVLAIEDITLGDEKNNYLLRYRGRLKIEPWLAYDQLAQALRLKEITTLFRNEDDRHAIILMQGVVHPKPSNPWVNLVLFILTVLSMLFSGTISAYRGPFSSNFSELWPHLLPALGQGLAFTVSMLGILLAHEFGHYLAARYHRTFVTLPYFIPFPLSSFGTMGAFIQLKEPPRNKRILLDIGIAGPLAGLVVAVPVLLIGLALSPLDRLPLAIRAGEALSLEGNSILYLLAKLAVFGRMLPEPATYAGLHPVLYWLRYFFTGLPTPYGGTDVLLHPVAWAGWAGLLVTALNLIPAGQLDGGHILYVLFGRKARLLLPVVLITLMVLGVFWNGWWMWALLIFLIGRFYAEPLDQITQLDPRRKAVAILGIVIFFLVFTPVPLQLFS